MTIRRQLDRLVIASLLPAALAAGLLIFYSYRLQRDSIADATLDTARAMVQAVDQSLASGRSALQVLATSPHLTIGDMAAFDRQAHEALAEIPGDSVVVSDASGQQLVNTMRTFGTPLPLHGNPEQVQRVFETGRPHVSDLFTSPVRQRPIISIEVPARRNGRVVYALSMGIVPARLGEILKQQALPPGWIAAIVDSQGRIVARTHEADRFIGHEITPALKQRVMLEREGELETETLEGVPVVTVFSRSASSNWSVAIGIPRAQLTRELWISFILLNAVTLGLLILGSFLSRRISARISRSIRGLIAPAAALARSEEIVIPKLEVVEAQELGHALENAARMLREREEILAVVTHDLRSPLSSLTLGLEAAERMAVKPGDGEHVRKTLASLGAIVRRMSGLVNDLLAVAVSARGKSSMLKMTPANAAALVQQAADTARPLLDRAGIELVIDCSSALPDVQADPDRIQRAFVNLLDNALKFTHRSGKVVLSAHDQPDAVRFCVSNSGPGLQPEALGRLFEPFWQAHEDKRGAGLGLSICRSIVESHGGRIWAEPEPGMCVRMCFEIPHARKDHEAGA